MIEFNLDPVDVGSFDNFLQQYKKEKAKNPEIQLFGVMNFSMKGISLGSRHFFLNQRLKEQESDLFDGIVYMALTDIAEGTLQDIAPLNEWDRYTALEKALKFDHYPTFFVLSPYENMQNRYEQHEMLSTKSRTILKNIPFFYIATEDEFKKSIEEAYHKNSYLLSPNRQRYEELKDELENAMEFPLLYDYATNEYGENEYYEEQAYYLPEKECFYVQAYGGIGTPMVMKGEKGMVASEGFSSFSEKEFVHFVFERLEKGEMPSLEKIHASPLLLRVLNKYRLKRLFEEIQII